MRSASAFLAAAAGPPLQQMITLIDRNKHDYAARPIYKEMQIAPSTSYAAINRPPSKRSQTNEKTGVKITDAHSKNYGAYNVRKVHAQRGRDR